MQNLRRDEHQHPPPFSRSIIASRLLVPLASISSKRRRVAAAGSSSEAPLIAATRIDARVVAHGRRT